jgi:energy-coupling factor transporter transmembrane protein EcfT
MSQVIANISIFGLIMFVFIYFITTLFYIQQRKYEWFIFPFLFGLLYIILIFLKNIYLTAKLSKKNITDTNNATKTLNIKTCPEYWKKITDSDSNTLCSTKNIYGNTSIASVASADTSTNNDYNTISYNNTALSLNDINNQTTNDLICQKMFQSYFNYNDDTMTSKYTQNNKTNVAWVEYYNKCL